MSFSSRMRQFISKKHFFQFHPFSRDFDVLKCKDFESIYKHQNSRFIPIYNGKVLIRKSENGPMELVSYPLQEVASKLNLSIESINSNRIQSILIGIHEHTKIAYFSFPARDVLPWEDEQSKFQGMRSSISNLSEHDVTIASQAKMLLQWVLLNQYCGACGTKANTVEKSNSALHMECSNCHSLVYPRVDPVIISLVIDRVNNRVLLGRKAIFPKGMYSALAGFVEPGESIERAVQREIYEESHIVVDVNQIEILGSQTWPFSNRTAELMIGCIAYIDDADSQEIILNDEQEDVKWFTLDDIRIALTESEFGIKKSGKINFFIPPQFAMAWNLLQTWVQNEDTSHRCAL